MRHGPCLRKRRILSFQKILRKAPLGHRGENPCPNCFGYLSSCPMSQGKSRKKTWQRLQVNHPSEPDVKNLYISHGSQKPNKSQGLRALSYSFYQDLVVGKISCTMTLVTTFSGALPPYCQSAVLTNYMSTQSIIRSSAKRQRSLLPLVLLACKLREPGGLEKKNGLTV